MANRGSGPMPPPPSRGIGLRNAQVPCNASTLMQALLPHLRPEIHTPGERKDRNRGRGRGRESKDSGNWFQGGWHWFSWCYEKEGERESEREKKGVCLPPVTPPDVPLPAGLPGRVTPLSGTAPTPPSLLEDKLFQHHEVSTSSELRPSDSSHLRQVSLSFWVNTNRWPSSWRVGKWKR